MCVSEQFIPVTIEDNEVLVRFVYLSNFKKKVVSLERVEHSRIFIDTRCNCVSLQRLLYCNEDGCKALAKSIPGKSTDFVGFALFKKETFDKIVATHKLERADFEAIIKYSPMDENQQYYTDIDSITINTKGSPAHSDIVYIHPGAILDEEPNIALRQFSHKLSTACIYVIDDCCNDKKYCGEKFSMKFI